MYKYNDPETHKEFVERADKSRPSVLKVSHWLTEQGISNKAEEPTYAETHAQWEDHTDDGDIHVFLKQGIYRVEVKTSLKYDFRSLNDYPYEDVIFEEVRKINIQHEYPLHSYFKLNKSRTGFIEIPASTKHLWFQIVKYDSHYEKDIPFVTCPIEVLRYIPFDGRNDWNKFKF